MELSDEASIPILYEDRSVLAIDKPAGWMLVPFTWDRTSRNLQLAITSSVVGGEFWAQSRGLKFLQHIHRLDAETTGILLFAKSQGAVRTYSELFESRRMEKRYLAVVRGNPKKDEWLETAKLGPDPKKEHGHHRVDPEGKESETEFKVLERKNHFALIEARPLTGRTHQIRLHLAHAGLPIIGDTMYGAPEDRIEHRRRTPPMALRAIALEYQDPFTKRRIRIEAPREQFLEQFWANLEDRPSPAPEPRASEPARPEQLRRRPQESRFQPSVGRPQSSDRLLSREHPSRPAPPQKKEPEIARRPRRVPEFRPGGPRPPGFVPKRLRPKGSDES